MTLLDIIIQFGLGTIGFLAFMILYVAIFPIISRVGKFLYPDGDKGGQLALGFLALLVGFVCGVAIWFLGGELVAILTRM